MGRRRCEPGGAQGDKTGQGGHLYPESVADPGEQSRHRIHHAGVGQSAADDEHGRHGHHSGVAKAQKGLRSGYISGYDEYQQRRESDEIVTPTIPDKQDQRRADNAEDDYLSRGHAAADRSKAFSTARNRMSINRRSFSSGIASSLDLLSI